MLSFSTEEELCRCSVSRRTKMFLLGLEPNKRFELLLFYVHIFWQAFKYARDLDTSAAADRTDAT